MTTLLLAPTENDLLEASILAAIYPMEGLHNLRRVREESGDVMGAGKYILAMMVKRGDVRL